MWSHFGQEKGLSEDEWEIINWYNPKFSPVFLARGQKVHMHLTAATTQTLEVIPEIMTQKHTTKKAIMLKMQF